MNRRSRAWAVFAALGLYLTLRGYHSRDGDQAYRLPLLLHWQDPSAFASDPFVRAFDGFNPHRGYLALLDLASRPFGLSAGLFLLFAATFGITCLAFDRLARLAWPEGGGRVGVTAVLLVLVAKAGNVGTNHLFEAMLLDRLIALALGWSALAVLAADPDRGRRGAAVLLGLATQVHPSFGLQLGMLVATGWVAWAALGGRTGVSARSAIWGLTALGLALVPGVAMMAGSGARLLDGLPADDFLTLSATIQSPQHMLPHLWRMPQWLAWACFLLLAASAVASHRGERSAARTRLAILLIVNLAGLLAAWVAVEWVGSVKATVFQPFRMATVARGLCLVLMADHVRSLWDRGGFTGRSRVALLVAGLTGDWALVVATGVELASCLANVGMRRAGDSERDTCRSERILGAIALSFGLYFLSQHDTESGHVRLVAAIGAAALSSLLGRFMSCPCWTRRRAVAFTTLAWAVPIAALVVPNLADGRLSRSLAEHCRFGEWATDDVERLAIWCRVHTPPSARFVGPPGPKTFRLWSRRDLAFNRSASPYHAAGLADWASRFRDHVSFRGSIAEFARAYLRDRQALERRYQEMTDSARADLARRYQADHVIAAAPHPGEASRGPLDLLHVEGRYAVYRLKADRIATLPVRERSSR